MSMENYQACIELIISINFIKKFEKKNGPGIGLNKKLTTDIISDIRYHMVFVSKIRKIIK